MLVRKAPQIRASEITDERLYFNRREFLGRASIAAAAVAAPWLPPSGTSAGFTDAEALEFSTGSPFSTTEPRNSFEDVTSYNNFYEFGIDKGDPKRYAVGLKTRPWTVALEGHIAKPGNYHLEDVVKPHALEERVYRLRCVEAWSMVVPWMGFPLTSLIRRVEPTSKAKFVEFTTLYRPSEMPGQRRDVLQWPYVEGLRMEEALHPLTILAVGLYGKTLLNQNGAPLRLVVPWKYGFKSIKSIVKIRFVESEPATSWSASGPREYGFYANVNPEVDHPRWSQARERRIGEFFKRKTLPFNGYHDQVLGAGSVFRLRFHHRGHREADVHHRGLRRIRPARSSGGHLHRGHDPAPGWQEVAALASPDLRERCLRRGALPLARQGRHPPSAGLRDDARDPSWFSRMARNEIQDLRRWPEWPPAGSPAPSRSRK